MTEMFKKYPPIFLKLLLKHYEIFIIDWTVYSKFAHKKSISLDNKNNLPFQRLISNKSISRRVRWRK